MKQVECLSCRMPVHHKAVKCPHCGSGTRRSSFGCVGWALGGLVGFIGPAMLLAALGIKPDGIFVPFAFTTLITTIIGMLAGMFFGYGWYEKIISR